MDVSTYLECVSKQVISKWWGDVMCECVCRRDED